MEKQWGKNPEYTIYIFANWNHWHLPFGISWHGYGVTINNYNLKAYSFGFLCFKILLEIWRWKK